MLLARDPPSGPRTAFLASLSSHVNRVTSNLPIISGGLLGIENSLERDEKWGSRTYSFTGLEGVIYHKWE